MKLNIKILIAILLICGVVITIILLQTGIIENLPDQETCAGWEQKCADETKEFTNDGKVTAKLLYWLKKNPETIKNPSLKNCCNSSYSRVSQVQMWKPPCAVWSQNNACDTGKILKSNLESITNPSKDTCCEPTCASWSQNNACEHEARYLNFKLKSNLDTITNPSKNTCCEPTCSSWSASRNNNCGTDKLKSNLGSITNPSKDTCCEPTCASWSQNNDCDTCNTGKILKSNLGSIIKPSQDTCCKTFIDKSIIKKIKTCEQLPGKDLCDYWEGTGCVWNDYFKLCHNRKAEDKLIDQYETAENCKEWQDLGCYLKSNISAFGHPECNLVDNPETIKTGGLPIKNCCSKEKSEVSKGKTKKKSEVNKGKTKKKTDNKSCHKWFDEGNTCKNKGIWVKEGKKTCNNNYLMMPKQGVIGNFRLPGELLVKAGEKACCEPLIPNEARRIASQRKKAGETPDCSWYNIEYDATNNKYSSKNESKYYLPDIGIPKEVLELKIPEDDIPDNTSDPKAYKLPSGPIIDAIKIMIGGNHDKIKIEIIENQRFNSKDTDPNRERINDYPYILHRTFDGTESEFMKAKKNSAIAWHQKRKELAKKTLTEQKRANYDKQIIPINIQHFLWDGLGEDNVIHKGGIFPRSVADQLIKKYPIKEKKTSFEILEITFEEFLKNLGDSENLDKAFQ